MSFNFLKIKITLLFLFFSLTLFSQENDFAGEYHLELINTEKNKIEYWLTLNPDKTFLFHSYTYNQNGIPTIVNRYGKGVWNSKNMILSFTTDKEKDIDTQHRLDFTNTRAHFITKHPRDITNRIVKTKLQFFESEIHWIPKTELFKR